MWQSVVLCSISLKEIQIYFPIRSENRLSIELWVELVEDLCFKDWMRVDDSGWISGEENRKPTLLYSTRSLEDWRGGELFLFYFTRWVKYCIDQQRVHTNCYMSSVSVSRLLNKWFLELLQILIWKKPIPSFLSVTRKVLDTRMVIETTFSHLLNQHIRSVSSIVTH